MRPMSEARKKTTKTGPSKMSPDDEDDVVLVDTDSEQVVLSGVKDDERHDRPRKIVSGSSRTVGSPKEIRLWS